MSKLTRNGTSCSDCNIPNKCKDCQRKHDEITKDAILKLLFVFIVCCIVWAWAFTQILGC